MKIKSLLACLVTLFAALFFTSDVSGQGVIVPIICDIRPCRPRPLPHPLPPVLPVKSIKLDTRIEGQAAVTHVEQVFRNDTPYTLEGTYFFPIPESASITEFAIWENGKKLIGEVRSREDARRIYDEIVRKQRDPGLLEYAGKDLFQASIFPIPPNSDKKLEITYSQILKAESGTVAYRYALGTGRNLWRRPIVPLPEAPVRSLNRGEASHPTQKFGTVSGKIEIIGKSPLRNIYSPTHTIDVSNRDDRHTTVSFESNNNDNDFQLFYGLSDEDFSLTLLTYREPGKDGYFLLLLSPRDNISEQELVNKDIIFVLDTSGSMAEAGKMEKARAALLFGIRTLREGDRFNIINFSGEEHLMEKGFVKVDEAGRNLAEKFIENLKPNGGTNINDSLIASLKQFENNERPKMLVFMTDGLPTVGETNIEKILTNFQKARNVDVRVFPFGFGYDVNTMLLDRLGSENLGVSDYIQPKEDLEVKVSNFFTRVSSPVLSGLEMDFGGVETELMYPRSIGDIFKGMQVSIIGKYKNDADLRDVVFLLKGKSGKSDRSFSFDGLDFPLRSTGNDFLPRLWASRRVGWLIEQIRINGETKELKDEVTDLGTRFGIVTPYTSYLATDGSPNSPVTEVTEVRGAFRPRSPDKRALQEMTGKNAVTLSIQQNKLKSQVSLDSQIREGEEDQLFITENDANRFVGNRRFFLENNIWVDSEFKPENKLPEVILTFADDAYFDLLAREPELAKFFALGEEVVVVWKGKVYRVKR